jgi:hypothetical protein
VSRNWEQPLLSDATEQAFSPEERSTASSQHIVVSFQNSEWWIKSRKTAILNASYF